MNISIYVKHWVSETRPSRRSHCFWSGLDTKDIPTLEVVINVIYPKDSPFLEHEQIVSDFRQLIDSYQIHHNSKQCRLPDGKCRFGHPQRLFRPDKNLSSQLSFYRHSQETNIITRDSLLFAYFQCHHCLEVTHKKSVMIMF
jgi:hypothetical protein